MLYRDGKIYIDVREAVATARRGISSFQPFDEDEPSVLTKASDEAVELVREVVCSDICFVVSGRMRILGIGSAELSFSAPSARELGRREFRECCRGEAFMLGAMYMAGDEAARVQSIDFLIKYVAADTTDVKEEREEISRERLEAFFTRCMGALPSAGKIEIERVRDRLPSMKKVKFPYGEIRAGQSEFIHAAYRAIARGGELFASAPTGTGKTVSALFPAIRALGDGRCEKVFYLTPKTTTAIAAKECIELMCEKGAFIRAVILTAKDKLCKRGHICREAKKLCPTYRENKLSAATLELAERGISVITAAEISEVAEKFSVCPYELSLSYSELCDVIICDFNYLFDPDVYIRRFFTRGGSFAFLVDEAHNLPERAREMYSAELSLSDIGSPILCEQLSPHSELPRVMHAAQTVFSDTLMPLLRDELRRDKDGTLHGAYHTRELPSDFYTLFPTLCEAAEDALFNTFSERDDEASLRASAIREYLYKIKSFAAAIQRFDENFELFVFLDGDILRAKIFCLDTGAVIREKLELGRAAILFSGTLSPIDYYRSVLGGDNSSATVEVDSPFDTEQLSVSIMNTVTTRISERDKSLSAVCSIIAATLSAKRGNYMIFSPSFAYSEALYKAFVKKYPKIHAILQTPGMSAKEKSDFLDQFSLGDGKYLAAFCVMGGIYSEGVDLVGDKLIGAVVVGIGMPALSYEREAIAAYYQDKLECGMEYAYLYPGMNRVLQAAGRVIRTENDRGVIVLVDDRFNDPLYKKIIPKLWGKMKFLPDAKTLREKLEKFWSGNG